MAHTPPPAARRWPKVVFFDPSSILPRPRRRDRRRHGRRLRSGDRDNRRVVARSRGDRRRHRRTSFRRRLPDWETTRSCARRRPRRSRAHRRTAPCAERETRSTREGSFISTVDVALRHVAGVEPVAQIFLARHDAHARSSSDRRWPRAKNHRAARLGAVARRGSTGAGSPPEREQLRRRERSIDGLR